MPSAPCPHSSMGWSALPPPSSPRSPSHPFKEPSHPNSTHPQRPVPVNQPRHHVTRASCRVAFPSFATLLSLSRFFCPGPFAALFVSFDPRPLAAFLSLCCHPPTAGNQTDPAHNAPKPCCDHVLLRTAVPDSPPGSSPELNATTRFPLRYGQFNSTTSKTTTRRLSAAISPVDRTHARTYRLSLARLCL